jgi:hypothetical protein
MTDGGDAKAFVARQLAVPADRVRLVRAMDGKTIRLVAVVESEPPVANLTLQKDDKTITVDGAGALILDVDLLTEDKIAEKEGSPYTKYRRVKAGTTPAAPEKPTSGYVKPFANPQAFGPNESLWLFAKVDDEKAKDGPVRLLFQDSARGKWVVADDAKPDALWVDYFTKPVIASDADIEFLKRVIKDARGTAPTALEEKYFAEDKDPKKREKLLDTLLKDAAVAKKLGDDWKKKMLATAAQEKARTFEYQIVPKVEWQRFTPIDPKSFKWEPTTPQEGFRYVDPINPGVAGKLKFTVPTPPTPATPVAPVTPKTPPTPATPKTTLVPKAPVAPKPPTAVKPPAPAAPKADQFEKLISELLAAKKSDSEMFEAISLVTLGRLPTEAEKRLTLGFVAKVSDRKTAWIEVARVLAGTGEGKQRSETLELKGTITGDGDAIELFILPTMVPPKP